MSVSHLPEPDPADTTLVDLLNSITHAVANIFGDITVGELLEAVEDLPIRDLLKQAGGIA